MEQDRIWEYFQTARVDCFDRAHGRYVAIAAEAQRRRPGTGGRALNIGVGPGVLERMLLESGWEVASLDPSASSLEVLSSLPIDARCGRAEAMDFESGSFDVVIASEVLEHIVPDTRRQVLAQIARVLRPGGWFIGSVPYREVLADYEVICPDCGKVFHRWGHVSSFDREQMHAELAVNFTDISCRLRSFVDWHAARTPVRLLKAVIQSMLGRMGEAIANPSIVFSGRKSSNV